MPASILKGELMRFLIVVAVVIAIIVGWIMNIIDLINATSITGLAIARAIGVLVWPLGAVLGYF